MSDAVESRPVRRPPRAPRRRRCCATFNDAGVLDAGRRPRRACGSAGLGGGDRRAVRSPPRSPCAGPGSATSASTSRRSARPRPSTPTSRSTSRALPWPRPAAGSTARGEPARRRRRGRRRRPAAAARRQPRSTSTATGARSGRSPPTCRRSRARRAGGVDDGRSPTGLARLFPDEDRRPPALRRRVPRSCAASPSSPAARAPARPRPSPASWRCSPSRPRGRRAAPLVALAAPTGKAAARLEEAVHEEAPRLDVDATPSARSCSARAAPRRCTGCSAGARQPQPLPPRPRQPAARTTS